jgi:hypothetical protein
MTELWHGEVERQLFAEPHEIDFRKNMDTIRYDCLFSCDSMAFEFDAGRDLWLMPTRFTVLQRAYLEAQALDVFLGRCEDIGANGHSQRGVITQLFARQHRSSLRKYRWGNCMIGWDFRGGGRYQPVLTMHSRVSYIAYIGGLDLALCCVLARYISERIGTPVEEFGFRWMLSSSQFHFFKSLPALYTMGYESEIMDTKMYPDREYPTISGVRKLHRRIINGYESGADLMDEKYGPLRRIRRRYMEHRDGISYSTPLSKLTFDPLYQETA